MVVDREVVKFGEKLAVAHRAQVKSLHSMTAWTILWQREDQKEWKGQVLRPPHCYLIAFLATQSFGKPCIHVDWLQKELPLDPSTTQQRVCSSYRKAQALLLPGTLTSSHILIHFFLLEAHVPVVLRHWWLSSGKSCWSSSKLKPVVCWLDPLLETTTTAIYLSSFN